MLNNLAIDDEFKIINKMKNEINNVDNIHLTDDNAKIEDAPEGIIF